MMSLLCVTFGIDDSDFIERDLRSGGGEVSVPVAGTLRMSGMELLDILPPDVDGNRDMKVLLRWDADAARWYVVELDAFCEEWFLEFDGDEPWEIGAV